MTYKNKKNRKSTDASRRSGREAARSVSAENERAEFLARAKTFEFLAEHCPEQMRKARKLAKTRQRRVRWHV